jgi:hypothetical protein
MYDIVVLWQLIKDEIMACSLYDIKDNGNLTVMFEFTSISLPCLFELAYL